MDTIQDSSKQQIQINTGDAPVKKNKRTYLSNSYLPRYMALALLRRGVGHPFFTNVEYYRHGDVI